VAKEGKELQKLIVTRMMAAESDFSISGKLLSEEKRNFNVHIRTRLNIIKLADDKKYKFGAGEEVVRTPIEPNVKSSVLRSSAYFNSINNSKTAIACLEVIKLTFFAGMGKPVIKQSSFLRKRDLDKWIPGDWGYIYNQNHQRHNKKMNTGILKSGSEGENIIHVGKFGTNDERFWGHITDDLTYNSINDWSDMINGWSSTKGKFGGKLSLTK